MLWAFIIVVAVNGIRAPFVQRDEPNEPAKPTNQKKTAFPVSAASAYAVQFAHVYLNYDQASPQLRARELAQFLPEGADTQLGWNGSGASQLQAVRVANVNVRDDRHAIVMLSVRVNDQRMRLAVPVYAAGEAMVISGQPALMAPPPKAQLPSAAPAKTDAAANRQLRSQLPEFFRAYASSNSASLSRFLVDGASVTGLGGSVRYAGLRDVTVPTGGKIRHMTATVVWQLPTADQNAAGGGRLEQTYQLTVVKQGDDWYIKDISGSMTMPTDR